MSRALIAAAIALLAAGCTTNFRPLTARRGTPASVATADASLTEGTYNMGDAAVWVDQADGHTIVLGMRLRNDGQTPMRLDMNDTAMEVRTKDGRMFVLDGAELEYSGEPAVGPGQTSRGEWLVQLPEDIEVGDLLGFELLWAVENDDGMRITRSSPFRHETWEESQYNY